MTSIASAYRRPNGLMMTLMILGGIDLLLGMGLVVLTAVGLGQVPHLDRLGLLNFVGLGSVLFMVLIAVRLGEVTVRAVWTRRLVRNIHLFHAFPVSSLWAWAGFVMPVVSLWMPAQTLLALAAAAQRPSRGLSLSCLAWALARWVTCPSGAFVAFAALVIVIRHNWRPEYSLLTLLTLAVPGVISAALGLVITPWIARRQPGPDQIHHAEVFT